MYKSTEYKNFLQGLKEEPKTPSKVAGTPEIGKKRVPTTWERMKGGGTRKKALELMANQRLLAMAYPYASEEYKDLHVADPAKTKASLKASQVMADYGFPLMTAAMAYPVGAAVVPGAGTLAIAGKEGLKWGLMSAGWDAGKGEVPDVKKAGKAALTAGATAGGFKLIGNLRKYQQLRKALAVEETVAARARSLQNSGPLMKEVLIDEYLKKAVSEPRSSVFKVIE